jgi:hypothetical protein
LENNTATKINEKNSLTAQKNTSKIIRELPQKRDTTHKRTQMMLEQMNSGHKLKELDNMLDQSSPLIIKEHKHELEISKLKKQ